MDVLKGITRELRGRDETRGDEDARTRRSEFGRARRGSAEDESRTGSTDADSTTQGGDDHLCPFCETAFDASRGSCPDCGAEIVLRGER